MSRHPDWREMFEKVEFYSVDLALLRDLGHEVIISASPKTLDLKADVYYTWWWGHAPYPMAAAKARRRPIIITGAFDYATCRGELPGLCYLERPAWQRSVLQAMLRLADANLFVSRYEHDEVTQHLRVNNPVLAPHAVDTDYYTPGDHADAEPFFFAVALSSRVNSIRKGLPQTIRAFALVAQQLPEVKLIIAGKPGDHLPELKAMAEQLGVADRVEFRGFITKDEKREAFRRCLAYVQPTLYEGFGLAIAEAVSCGAKIISARRGAVPEVAGPDATLVDPHDEQAIAAAMLERARSGSDPQERARRHQWIVDRYTLASRRAKLGEVLTAVTRKRRPRS